MVLDVMLIVTLAMTALFWTKELNYGCGLVSTVTAAFLSPPPQIYCVLVLALL